MWKDQTRLADKQTEMAVSGRKIAERQGKLAMALRRTAAANERNTTANERNAAANMVFATISASALNGFHRLSEEYFNAKKSERKSSFPYQTPIR